MNRGKNKQCSTRGIYALDLKGFKACLSIAKWEEVFPSLEEAP